MVFYTLTCYIFSRGFAAVTVVGFWRADFCLYKDLDLALCSEIPGRDLGMDGK